MAYSKYKKRLRKLLSDMEKDGYSIDVVEDDIVVVDREVMMKELTPENGESAIVKNWQADPRKYVLDVLDDI